MLDCPTDAKVSTSVAHGAPKKADETPLTSLRIVHFQRRPFAESFSIEVLFRHLRDFMQSQGRDVTCAELPRFSKGLWGRLVNLWWTFRHRGDVNHITGDVHYITMLLPRNRTLLTIHDCRTLERLTGLRRWVFKLLWFDLPIRRVAVVSVISEETKRQLQRHIALDPSKIEVVPNAVAPIYRPCPREFNADQPWILHIGTGENKNLPRLIQALSGIRCRLIIVGRLDASLSNQLVSAGIAFESHCDQNEEQMYRLYCESDLVSFVSTYEGFGMPIVEAQWVERPVVTSNCSSMPEVAGNGASLVDPEDVESIRRGICKVIQDSPYRERLIEDGRKNRVRFQLSDVAARYTAIYDRLAAERRSR